MKAFIFRRIGIVIPLLFLISVISFVIILLPPGSYVETYVQNLEERGFAMDDPQRGPCHARVFTRLHDDVIPIMIRGRELAALAEAKQPSV